MNTKIVVGVVVALALLLGGAYVLKGNVLGANATGPQHFQAEAFLQGIQIGQQGTLTKLTQSGTCNLSTGTASFAATTTAQFFCTVSGVQSGDLVLADLPVGAGANNSGGGSVYGGFAITAAYATTSNRIGVTLVNLTGAATTSYPQATTTVEYRIIR